MVSIDTLAPDFELLALIGGVKKPFRLSSQRGKRNVLLTFYPSNWLPSAQAQLTAYQAEKGTLETLNVLAVTVCMDSIMNTTAWEREIGPLDFPMCADFWPQGVVSRAYGVLREQEPYKGASERALFLIDRTGRILLEERYGVEEMLSFAQLLGKVRAAIRSRGPGE